MFQPIIPAIVSQRLILRKETLAKWQIAISAVREGQKAFVKAYTATLDDLLPNWRESWKTDPMFAETVADVESAMKEFCLANGMSLTVFNRYKTATRKAVFLDSPFAFGSGYSIRDIQRVRRGEVTVAEVKAQKAFHDASNVVAKTCTILPHPDAEMHEDDYIELCTTRLTEHLGVVRARLGEKAFKRLVRCINGEEAKTPEPSLP